MGEKVVQEIHAQRAGLLKCEKNPRLASDAMHILACEGHPGAAPETIPAGLRGRITGNFAPIRRPIGRRGQAAKTRKAMAWRLRGCITAPERESSLGGCFMRHSGEKPRARFTGDPALAVEFDLPDDCAIAGMTE
ncbi:MAG: hypothetical protein ACP5FH_09260 [Terracidiphilus sp.]